MEEHDDGAPDAPPSGAVEQQLVARVRGGDRAAFEALFLRYAPVLGSFLLAYVRSREVAEDLVHDLFLALWRERETWHPAGTIEAYLFLAARNRARNYLRHERIVQRWEERSARELAEASDDESADERLEALERQAMVIRAIAQLPERARLVATLRWVDGLTYPQIAQRLGITVKGVEKAVARAFQAIQQQLKS